jgi:hypothetical protein
MEELLVPIGYSGVTLQGVRCVTAQRCFTRSYQVYNDTCVPSQGVGCHGTQTGEPPHGIRYTMTPAYRHKLSDVTARKPVSRHKASGVALDTDVS